MGNNIINLRGHHISTFANFFLGDQFYHKKLPMHNPYFSSSIEDIGINFNDYVLKLFSRWGVTSNDGSVERYGEVFQLNRQKSFRALIENPDIRVRVVEGLDSLCLADCKKREKRCEGLAVEDQRARTEYNLIAKDYSSREIIDAVVRYTKETGFRSPRDMEEYGALVEIISKAGNLLDESQ